MRAAILETYGSPAVLRIAEVSAPTPGPAEILVRVAASTVTSGDARLRAMRAPLIFQIPMRLLFGVLRPRFRPGMEFAGTVMACGSEVDRFAPGQRVFGMVLRGATAELLALPQTGAVVATPPALTDREAAAVPFGALAALGFLRDLGDLRAGERLLVYGASGAVGTAAVQLGKVLGAHVTAACSQANLERVAALGADVVLDYNRQDPLAPNRPFDLVLDTIGRLSTGRARAALEPRGRLVVASFGLRQLLAAAWSRLDGGPRVVCGVTGDRRKDLEYVRDLIDAGALRPVIDRTFHLNGIVEAHAYVDSGRKVGAVVVDLG